MRPLLSITFPQGFRISKNIGHPTSGSGGKKTVKRYLKSEHTDRHTRGRTFRLIESIGPEGRCFENLFPGLLEVVHGTTQPDGLSIIPWFNSSPKHYFPLCLSWPSNWSPLHLVVCPSNSNNPDLLRKYINFLEVFSQYCEKHRKIAKSCPEHITLMLRCQVVKLFLLKDVTLTTTVTTVTITTITISLFEFCHNLIFFL